MMARRLEAVLFDLGDTLCYVPEPPPAELLERWSAERMAALLDAWNIHADVPLLDSRIRQIAIEATKTAYTGDLVSPSYPAVVRQAAQEQGITLSEPQVVALWQAFVLPGECYGLRLYPDALDTLRWLKRQGYRLGCVTNRWSGGSEFLREMQQLGLSRLFDVWAVSCDVGYMKPHPQIFLHTLQHLGIEAGAAAMVGDSLRADIEGAQALGMLTVLKRRPGPQEESTARPDYLIDRLWQLTELQPFRMQTDYR